MSKRSWRSFTDNGGFFILLAVVAVCGMTIVIAVDVARDHRAERICKSYGFSLVTGSAYSTRMCMAPGGRLYYPDGLE